MNRSLDAGLMVKSSGFITDRLMRMGFINDRLMRMGVSVLWPEKLLLKWWSYMWNNCFAWRVVRKYCRQLLILWVFGWMILSSSIMYFMNAHAVEGQHELLANMCDERARMLQDQFNVSMNHLQALAILVSTFHHSKEPSAIDQETFARYAERTAFERPLTSGVAYAVKVLHTERELFERQQGWFIKKMYSCKQSQRDDGGVHEEQVSPIAEEYAPVIFAQDAYKHVVSFDMLSGNEDRENILRSRESGKGVLTAPFRLLNNRLGVILTYAVYKSQLPSNATPEERIQSAIGYLGGIFDIEALVDKLLHQLASKQSIAVNVYDTTNEQISMYISNVTGIGIEHVSPLNFGDPLRRHAMQCRFTQKPPVPWLAISTSIGAFVIGLLIGHIFYATINRIAKVEDDYHEMRELKKRAEAADVAKSQFLATVSHEIRTPMNGVLGMLQMLMDTELDTTQQDYVSTAQASGKALVSLINEVLDQAKIESGKLELEMVPFDLRAVLDDMISLFCGKAQEKGLELAAYVSDQVPEKLIGDPGRMRQIITNLMGNSIKFTDRGHIYVTVHLADEVRSSFEVEAESSCANNTLSGFPVADRKRSWESFWIVNKDGYSDASFVSSSSDSVSLIISVEDTGVGIPYESQAHIFTPFMQARPSISRIHGGTGIGLSISKCLVGLMKGEIGFVSKPQVGSTFTFSATLSKTGCNEVEENKPPVLRGISALVVDHRPVRAKVTKYHLWRLGVQAEMTCDLNLLILKAQNGELTAKFVLFDKETLLMQSALWSNFVSALQHKVSSDAPKLVVLENPSSSLKSTLLYRDGLKIITKPLRASMLQISLRQALGGADNEQCRKGGIVSPSLGSLLQKKQILVVDDNLVNLKVAAGALKKYGAEVTCADSGKKAVAFLKPPHKFDACFMDIQMPEMDGFQATRKIREMEKHLNNRIQHGDILPEHKDTWHWHTPILAMTADVIQATYEECVRSGMDGYVSKPFEGQQLYREVSRFFQSDHQNG